MNETQISLSNIKLSIYLQHPYKCNFYFNDVTIMMITIHELNFGIYILLFLSLPFWSLFIVHSLE